MNPETTLVWHPFQGKLKDLKVQCLLEGARPPHWMRIENAVPPPGFPDVWWAWGSSGTIELKQRRAAPVGEDTPCVIESIQPQQRLFWRQCHEAGGSIHVLTRVGREWFLHTGDWARQWLGIVPIKDMRTHNLFSVGDDPCLELPDARTVLLICGAMS